MSRSDWFRVLALIGIVFGTLISALVFSYYFPKIALFYALIGVLFSGITFLLEEDPYTATREPWYFWLYIAVFWPIFCLFLILAMREYKDVRRR